jgi:hypothetical protein
VRAVVSQEPTLFSGTIAENILYGLGPARDQRGEAVGMEAGCPTASERARERERVEAVARLANAHDFVVGLAEGYDSEVGERGVQLSGGQRQRIAIARCTHAHTYTYTHTYTRAASTTHALVLLQGISCALTRSAPSLSLRERPPPTASSLLRGDLHRACRRNGRGVGERKRDHSCR